MQNSTLNRKSQTLDKFDVTSCESLELKRYPRVQSVQLVCNLLILPTLNVRFRKRNIVSLNRGD